MVRPQRRPKTTTDPVARRPAWRTIGFVGKGTITDYEEAILTYIGRCTAVLGHTLLIVEAPGATSAVRKGVEMQGGEVRVVPAGVLDIADRTLLYPDTPLLDRIKKAHPDLDQRDDVLVIHNLPELEIWLDNIKRIVKEYNLDLP